MEFDDLELTHIYWTLDEWSKIQPAEHPYYDETWRLLDKLRPVVQEIADKNRPREDNNE